MSGDFCVTAVMKNKEEVPKDITESFIGLKQKKPQDQIVYLFVLLMDLLFIGYLQDTIFYCQGWKRHFFCLTKNKLFWTEEQTKSEDDDDDEGADGNGVGEVSKSKFILAYLYIRLCLQAHTFLFYLQI